MDGNSDIYRGINYYTIRNILKRGKELKTLIISYSNYTYDGRLKELIATMKLCGTTTTIVSTDENITENQIIAIKKMSNYYLSYLFFTIKVILFYVKNRKEYDVILLDNITSSLPGIIIKAFAKKKFYVQDVRELYFPKDLPGLFGKILSILEGVLIKRSNIVIVANKQRANIMKEYYKIKLPYVYDNIRLLGPIIKEDVSNKDVLSENDVFKIISTGGVTISRGIMSILEAFKELPKNFELNIVGGSNDSDLAKVNKYLKENNLYNVKIIGTVKMDKLYNLVKESHVGIVNYHFDDLNNLYCASGKVYEYLGCSIPVVTTENPPLKDFCEEYKVGQANNNFKESLLFMYENYFYFKNNASEFAKNIDVFQNNIMLSKYISEEYRKY